MRKQYTTEEKQNLVAMFKNGSQTITAFAQANGIEILFPVNTGFHELQNILQAVHSL